MQKIIVVTPTHNAKSALSHVAERLFAEDIPGLEWLIVDDHSTDGTAAHAESLRNQYDHKIHVLRHKGPHGVAAAYREGFHKAADLGAEVIVQMDAVPHQPQCMAQMLDLLNRGHFDMVIGARYLEGVHDSRAWPRKALSGLVRASTPAILNMPINDASSGFRAWRTRVLQEVGFDWVQTKGDAFMVEMAYRAHRLGYRIGEVPVYVTDCQSSHQTENELAQDAASRLWLRLRYRGLTPSQRKRWHVEPA